MPELVFGGRARCGNRLFEFGLYSCGTRSYGGGLIRHRSVPGGWYIVCMMVWIMRIVCQNTEYRRLQGLDCCLRRNDPRLRHAGAGSRVWIRRLRPNQGPAQSLNDRVGAEVFSRCDGFGIIRVPDSSAALRFARNDKSGGLSGPGMTPAYDMRGQAQGSGFGVLVPDRGPG